jgi:hypothetical protein
MKSDVIKRPWHDAVLTEIRIDRSNPGYADSVELFIRWPGGRRSSVMFNDCYAMQAEMNFGIVAQETVRSFDVLIDDEMIDSVRAAFTAAKLAISDLKCFVLETNSTASSIKILARSVNIVDETSG